MTANRRNQAREKMILIVTLIIVPLAAVFGILEYQDWQAVKRRTKGVRALGPDNPPSPENFEPGRAVPEQPTITKLKIVTAREAGTRVEDDELVVGVVIGDQARAYPINMMTGPAREVFNDQLAGRPIAATW